MFRYEMLQRLTLNEIDNVLITKDGIENLTPTPKEVDDITALITEV